jgi:hypothetical protein
MNRLLLAATALVAAVGTVRALDKITDDRVKVDVLLADEHVPKGLKAGTRADLKMVQGKTSTPNGLTMYRSSLVAADVEVASIDTVDKPATPEGAVKVQLLVSKDVAEKIVKTRDRLVTVIERKVDGVAETKKKPVTLRLELVMAEKK